MITSATLPLRDSAGKEMGVLVLSCLAGRERWRDLGSLVEVSTDDRTAVAASVQLLEEMSYSYIIELPNAGVVERIEPAELVSSTNDRSRGRLEARRATGTVTFTVTLVDGTEGSCEFEIRSRKLGYETDYQAMLQRIAREAAELVQSSFAASSLRGFRPNTIHDADTLYQRFAFMQALLESSDVQHALDLIRRRPHHEHVESSAEVDPARSGRSSRHLVRELTAAGPRQQIRRSVAGLTSLPHSINERTHLVTHDTVPNRFVKYVLSRWRNLAIDVANQLPMLTTADDRGQREATRTAAELTRALSSPALADAGRLDTFPEANQVIQGRTGYREILEAFLLAEAASTIDWDERTRLFAAGQRDVADLYEHWVFLELVRIVERLPGLSVDKRGLVRHSRGRLTLNLSRTGGAVLSASGFRRGRQVKVEVWFNRSFSHAKADADGTSWTEPMRPDCSIRISPRPQLGGADTWVHFDAKYRITGYTPALEDAAEEGVQERTGSSERPVPADLAKMHAYRDAIRQTAGAYVLYPGGDTATNVRRQQYHEILPGLGAFVLRPTASGEASDASTETLERFLEEVIDHVAAQGTAAERSRYWGDRSYRSRASRQLDFEPALDLPPRDTQVLLGFVRSKAHLEWCQTTGLYNLRADPARRGAVELRSPELAVHFVVLYDAESVETWAFSATGAVYLKSGVDLRSLDYPDPRGAQYACLGIEPARLSLAISGNQARALAGGRATPVGSPRVVTWADLAEAASSARV